MEGEMREHDMAMMFEADEVQSANKQMAKIIKQKYEGSDRHKPANAAILIRVGRERAKRAMKLSQQES
jgi:hypoxanthine-guanine phosphoribosyltransferase